MADEKYKSVSTFALPDEYQRQASEARRRRRMAEMLAQQAYQPGDIQNAPIPRGAPLVQGLQAYLTARAARKADEAEETAAKTKAQFEADTERQIDATGGKKKTSCNAMRKNKPNLKRETFEKLRLSRNMPMTRKTRCG